MKKIKLTTFILSLLFASHTFAAPHFQIQMQNRGDKNATVTFQSVVGNVSLDPGLNDNTPLVSHSYSGKYGVVIEPLDEKSNFNIVFKGEKECTFNVAFYAPARPKITQYGLGCYGGGYQIIDNGHTLLLYISDIKMIKKN